MVQIIMHAFSRGQDFVNEKVTIAEAFEFLNVQSTEIEYDDNFIGFSPETDNTVILQFIRHNQESWTVDIPTYVENDYKGSLNTAMHKDLVFSLVRDFFDENNQLYANMLNHRYDEVNEYCKVRYGIIFDFEVNPE